MDLLVEELQGDTDDRGPDQGADGRGHEQLQHLHRGVGQRGDGAAQDGPWGNGRVRLCSMGRIDFGEPDGEKNVTCMYLGANTHVQGKFAGASPARKGSKKYKHMECELKKSICFSWNSSLGQLDTVGGYKAAGTEGAITALGERLCGGPKANLGMDVSHTSHVPVERHVHRHLRAPLQQCKPCGNQKETDWVALIMGT